ncbi:hypothetical protein M3183_18985 [Neobacillus mesonae]|nr:hypothetical protein [Neobacillus mesonae]
MKDKIEVNQGNLSYISKMKDKMTGKLGNLSYISVMKDKITWEPRKPVHHKRDERQNDRRAKEICLT